MSNSCEVTFCELRSKEVINIVDGRCLGHIVDLVFDLKSGRLLGLIAPGCRRFFFKVYDDIFIPWRSVCKIGDDVILVELRPSKEYGGAGYGERVVYGYGAEEGGAEVRAESTEDEGRYRQYYNAQDDNPPRE